MKKIVMFKPAAIATALSALAVSAHADVYADAATAIGTTMTGMVATAGLLVGLAIAVWAALKLRSFFGK